MPRAPVLILFAIFVASPNAWCQDTRATSQPATQPTNQAKAEKPGGWRLEHANSLYLREHAENPVDWFPWGSEALSKAKQENKPIFLSIGYSSCHWCHVMRRKSFTQEDVAAALRKGFIAIKVDREELPHVDDAYMSALQAMNRGGGWPLSAFLTPEGKPFFGGTYFPKDAFLELLASINSAWNDPDEQKRILEAGSHVVTMLEAMVKPQGQSKELRVFLDEALEGTLVRYDTDFGGFSRPGVWSPKFPHPRLLVYYTALDRLEDRPEVRKVVTHTLRAMARGGIFDQVGGGFHRYTVDRKWIIPHFEKMLYSQGLLGETYLEVHRMTGEQEFADVARRTLDALLRDFGLESGGFASAWDADSEEEEGIYYLWRPENLEAAVGKQLAPLMTAHLGVTDDGNFVGGKEHSFKTIPTIARTIPELAEDLMMEPAEVQELVTTGLEKMLAARSRRIPPKRDDKVILGWNALAVSALAKGAVLLDDPRYLRAAEQTQALLRKHLAHDDGFRRVYFGVEGAQPATLTDAALYVKACLDLYEATLNPKHLAEARRSMAQIERDFGPTKERPGGFFEAKAGDEILTGRKKTFWDSALPSGNATLAHSYIRLNALTAEEEYDQHARAIIEEAVRDLANYPGGSPQFLLAMLMQLSPLPEVAIVGDPKASDTQQMIRAVRRGTHPFSVLALRPPGEAGKAAARVIPLLDSREAKDGKATAYLCIDFTCQAPETDLKRFKAALAASWLLPEPDEAPVSQPSSRPSD